MLDPFGDDPDRSRAGGHRGDARNRLGSGQNADGNSFEVQLAVEDCSGDANFAGEIAGEGEMVARIGNGFDDRPQCRVGADRQFARVSCGFCLIIGRVFSTGGDEGDDDDESKQEGSDHKHHAQKLEPGGVRKGDPRFIHRIWVTPTPTLNRSARVARQRFALRIVPTSFAFGSRAVQPIMWFPRVS